MEDLLDTTDPFLQLLTDALRAGPGSPEWQQAVARVNAGETGPDDEYALLVRTRENLASGKDYREVKPGVGFTRKVMQGIDSQVASAKKSPISASLISYIGAGVVVAMVAVLIFWLTQSGGGESEDLTNLFFTTTRWSASLDGPLPTGWKLFGPLIVDPVKGLAPMVTPKAVEVIGGGVVSIDSISASDPFQVEATFQFQHVSDDVIPQLFVTDDPDFSKDRGVSPHELVWLVSGGAQHVALPDSQLTSISRKVLDGQSVQIRIVVGASNAVVLCDGAVLWSGSSQLANRPRYVGVRLLCRKGSNAVTVHQLRVMSK